MDRFTATGLILLGLLPATSAQSIDAELTGSDRFAGFVSSPADQDLVRIVAAKGTRIDVSVKRLGNGELAPALALLDAAFAEVALGGALHLGASSAAIDGFVLPASGPWHLRIGSQNGSEGTYELRYFRKVKAKFAAHGQLALGGEIEEIAFAAEAGSKLSGSIARTGGALKPLIVELFAPSGTLHAFAGAVHVKSGGKTAALDGLALDETGDWRLRIAGKNGSTGKWKSKLKLKAKKQGSGFVYEDEYLEEVEPELPPFALADVSFGRGLRQPMAGRLEVVSPLTTVEEEPLSGLPLVETLAPLVPGGDVAALAPFPLDGGAAPIVPRNAVLALTFTAPVDADSLALDGARMLTPASPIAVEFLGEPVPLQVFVDGARVLLNPVAGAAAGFPPAPFGVDASGVPVLIPGGAARLALTSVGPNALRSAQGLPLSPRADLLGTPDQGGEPIGFQPGNAAVDFAAAGAGDFNGSLPDLTPPRLVREVSFGGVYQPGNGDAFGAKAFSVVLPTGFVTAAEGGAGEWRGGVLELRPGQPDAETHRVESNTTAIVGFGVLNKLALAAPIEQPLAAGESWRLRRAEFFEPDPAAPIDPSLVDPLDPESALNGDLFRFVEAKDPLGVSQDLLQLVNPRSTFELRFSEPIDLSSALPYETLLVQNSGSALLHDGIVARVTASDGGRRLRLAAEREIQFGPSAGSVEALAFSGVASSLRLRLRSVPEPSALAALLEPTELQQFLARGERGLTDLAGRPLAIPPTLVSAADPVAEFDLPFSTTADTEAIGTGAVVHLFRGFPMTGGLPDGTTGVTYGDVPPEICGPNGNLYGDRIADFNLYANGFLSGAPVQFLQKIHDDFNPEPSPQMNAFPFGVSAPLGGFSVLGGARFQHVYRAVDCSPDWLAYAGSLLDLRRVSWAPIGGSVTNTIIPDLSIHAGHSCIVPDTKQNQGIPSLPNTGLSTPSLIDPDLAMGGHYETLGDPASGYVGGNYNAFGSGMEPARRQLVHGTLKPGAVADAYDGKPYVIDSANLVSLPGTGRTYLPLPNGDFDHPFPFDNGARDPIRNFAPNLGYTGAVPTWGGVQGDPIPHSLVLEYRVRVADPNNPPSTSNAFTFAVGILSSALPRFRVFSMGAGCLACCVDSVTPGNCGASCSVSLGPALNGLAGGGGVPLEPDLVRIAAGPAPAPPSMACFCLRPPQNPLAPPIPGCVDKTVPFPTIDQVAYGTVPPPATNPGVANFNNFGDNARYFMVFDYVKRTSRIVSPFVRAQPASIAAPTWLAPIFDPRVTQVPPGTALTVRFRASINGVGDPLVDSTAWVTPQQMIDLANPLNDGISRPFIQFEAVFESNTSTQITPILDTVVIPFRK